MSLTVKPGVTLHNDTDTRTQAGRHHPPRNCTKTVARISPINAAYVRRYARDRTNLLQTGSRSRGTMLHWRRSNQDCWIAAGDLNHFRFFRTHTALVPDVRSVCELSEQLGRRLQRECARWAQETDRRGLAQPPWYRSRHASCPPQTPHRLLEACFTSFCDLQRPLVVCSPLHDRDKRRFYFQPLSCHLGLFCIGGSMFVWMKYKHMQNMLDVGNRNVRSLAVEIFRCRILLELSSRKKWNRLYFDNLKFSKKKNKFKFGPVQQKEQSKQFLWRQEEQKIYQLWFPTIKQRYFNFKLTPKRQTTSAEYPV